VKWRSCACWWVPFLFLFSYSPCASIIHLKLQLIRSDFCCYSHEFKFSLLHPTWNLHVSLLICYWGKEYDDSKRPQLSHRILWQRSSQNNGLSQCIVIQPIEWIMNFPTLLTLQTPLDHRTRPLTNFARSSKSTYDIVHMLSPCHILYGNKLYYYIRTQDTYKNFLSYVTLWRTRHKRGLFLSRGFFLSWLHLLWGPQ
jgi:hypothetical protein